MEIDYLINVSVWIHTVILGAMIPPMLMDVRAKRAAIHGLPGFVSDHLGFFLFIVSSIIAVAIIQPIIDSTIHSWLVSNKTLPFLAGSNMIFLFIELAVFKILILGRK